MNQPLYPQHLVTKATVRRSLRPASQLMSLEQRFMFDGAVADAAHAAQAHDTPPPPIPPAVTVRAAEPAKDDGKKEVVLVDTSLANYKSLEAGVRDGVGIVEFDGSRDGLAQIAQWAASQSGLDAIHILSHGSEGVVNLGTNALTESSLASSTTQAELAQLGRALTADGDLLLYGCDVAAGTEGAQLLDGIAQATGADVAASTDLTGAARLGGDWTLEKHVGDIDARELALTQYDGVLEVVSFRYGPGGDGDDFGTDVDGDGHVNTITKLVGGKNITFASGGTELYVYDDVNGVYSLSADQNTVVLSLTIEGGYTFDLNGLDVASFGTSLTINYVKADGSAGTPIGATISDSGSLSGVPLSLQDVRSVTLTSVDYTTFQNFAITDVKALPPPIAAVDSAHLSIDSGNGNAGTGTDFITNTAAQTISGTLLGNLAYGEKVEVSYNNGSTWSDATSYAVGTNTWSTTTTLAGSNTFIARVTNGGSTSQAFSHSYALDTAGPTITNPNISISGGTGTGGAYKIGDTVTATWNNTAGGDNNVDALSGITANFSAFGGGTAVSATNSGGIWTASYTISAGSIDLANRNVSFSATDNAGNTTTTTDSTNAVVDSVAPTVTDGRINISGGTGTGGAYKIGDTVTATWNNTAGGDNNTDTISSATVNFSAFGGGTAVSATNSGGTWTATYTITAGSIDLANRNVSVTATDNAGNTTTTTDSTNAVVDSVAPTVTDGRINISGGTGTGGAYKIGDTVTATWDNSGAGDNNTDTISSATVNFSQFGGGSAVAAINVGGIWTAAYTITSGALNDVANRNVAVTVVDNAGNTTIRVDTANATVDNVGPATPGTPDLATASDTGSVNNDNVTLDNTPTLNGTAENGSKVDIYDGATLLGTVTAGVGGWTYIPGALTQGSHTITAVSTDTAGNVSAASSGLTITVDTNAPATPGTPVLATASDTGSSNSDGVTADAAPTLSGTAENGSTVDIYDGATLLDTVIAGVGGWTYTTNALSEGSHTITVVSTDLAGNVSAASALLTFTVDTIAPTVTSVATPANGTYYSGGTLDFTVNFDEAVTVDSTGGTPRIAITVGATTRYADYVSGSGTSALVFRYIVPNGDIDANGIMVGALSPNGGTLRDGAGNAAETTLNSVGSTAAVNVDGTNPSVTGVSASTADGAYGSGQTITITVGFSGAVNVDTTGGTPTLALDGGGVATYTGGSGSNTLTFSYTVGAGENSADLDYSSSSALSLNNATIIDAGGAHQAAALTLATPGTAGSLGANKDLAIDTAAPTNTIDSAAFSADTGSFGSDFITKTASQTISGTLSSNLAAGENVYVSLDNGGSWDLATASVGINTWSLAGQTLTGSGTLKVRVTDDAGNNGTAYTQAYVLDTTAPTISFSGVALSADNGASNTDLITNTAAQTISATLSAAPAAGDVVYGSLDNGATWTDITSKVSGTTLTWNGVTLSASDTLQLRVTDSAGNDGAATSAAYVLDISGPTTSVASVSFSGDSGALASDFITKTAAQTISGTLSANLASGESVLVSLDNGVTWHVAAAIVGSDGWSLAGQTLSASDTLQVKVSDTAGNDGAVLSQAYVYDTAATVPTVDTVSTSSLTPVLTGSATLAAGETMTVSVAGATYDVVPVAGSWSLDLATAVPSSGALTLVLNTRYSVVATVTDLAGNVASDSSTNELTVGVISQPSSQTAPPLPVETQTPQPVPPINVTVQPQDVPKDVVVGDINSPPPTPVWISAVTPGVTALDSTALSTPIIPMDRPVFFERGDVLVANAPIPDLALQSGGRFSYQIASDTFSHSGGTADLTLSAVQSDGKPLPGWLKFDPRTGRFEGTPPIAFEGTLSFKVIAKDAQGRIAVQTFKVVVSRDGTSAKSAGLSHELAEPVGRASLGEQIHATRSAGAERLAMMARLRA
jgi:hypothetical protein